VTAFKVNLIRDVVPSPMLRTRIFRGVLAHFAAFGILTAMVAWWHTVRIVNLHGRSTALAIQEKWFRKEYPDVTDFKEYSEDLRLGLEHCAAQLAGIRNVMGGRLELPPVMLALLQPMTAGMRLGSFSVDREKKSFGFEISVPAATFERQRRNDTDIMTAWNENPVLRTRLKSIVLIGSRRSRGPTGFEYVLTFSGVLKDARTTQEP
jgi:hypothetical protein